MTSALGAFTYPVPHTPHPPPPLNTPHPALASPSLLTTAVQMALPSVNWDMSFLPFSQHLTNTVSLPASPLPSSPLRLELLLLSLDELHLILCVAV